MLYTFLEVINSSSSVEGDLQTMRYIIPPALVGLIINLEFKSSFKIQV